MEILFNGTKKTSNIITFTCSMCGCVWTSTHRDWVTDCGDHGSMALDDCPMCHNTQTAERPNDWKSKKSDYSYRKILKLGEPIEFEFRCEECDCRWIAHRDECSIAPQVVCTYTCPGTYVVKFECPKCQEVVSYTIWDGDNCEDYQQSQLGRRILK